MIKETRLTHSVITMIPSRSGTFAIIELDTTNVTKQLPILAWAAIQYHDPNKNNYTNATPKDKFLNAEATVPMVFFEGINELIPLINNPLTGYFIDSYKIKSINIPD